MKHLTTKIYTFMFAVSLILCSCQSGSSSLQNNNDSNKHMSNSGPGKDTYIELTDNTSGSNLSVQVLMKYYLSSGGKARSEMYSIKNGNTSLDMVGLADINKPTETILLDDSAKTYSVNKIDTGTSNDIIDAHTKYAVTKIGNETIQGLNCIHAQILKTTTFSGATSFMNGTDTTDIWFTKDINVPPVFEKSFTKSMGLAYNKDVAAQLAAMGCEGFPAKFQVHSKTVSSLMQLTKISHDDFPAGMFDVPAGYKQEEGM